MDNEKGQVSINLLELLDKLKRFWVVILLCGLICGAIGFVYTSYFVTPLYEANCRMIVTTREDANNNVTTDQLTSAQQMINTYTEILLGRDYLEQIIYDLKLDMKYNQLRGKIGISAAVDTQIMEITVRDADIKQAKKIAVYIYNSAPTFTKEIVKIGSLDQAGSVYAVNDGSPVYPNVSRTSILGFLIGCIIPTGIIVLLVVFESTYKNDADLKNDLGLPVLGVIPSIDSVMNLVSDKIKGRRVK